MTGNPISKKLILACMLVLSASLAVGCGGGRYHWDQVPYCKVEKGQAGSSFVRPLIRVLTRHSNGGGIGLLHGQAPNRSVVTRDEVLVAMVTCQDDTLRRQREPVPETLTADNIPLICNGQKTLVKPVKVKVTATTVKGYDGKLVYPKVPTEALKCKIGTLAYGSGASTP